MYTFSTERLIAATPAAIFTAIQDPARLARWWGPQGFSNRFEIFEFTPGGRWEFAMIGPDGKHYANSARFSRIDPDKQIDIQHLSPPHFELSIRLEANTAGTLLHWTQTFADAKVGEALRPIVEPANEQNLDRLRQQLNVRN